jgi:hypothetical protein
VKLIEKLHRIFNKNFSYNYFSVRPATFLKMKAVTRILGNGEDALVGNTGPSDGQPAASWIALMNSM